MSICEMTVVDGSEYTSGTLESYNIVVQRWFFFFQAEDGIRDLTVTGVQTCALPISPAQSLLKSTPIQALTDSTWLIHPTPPAPRGGGPRPLPDAPRRAKREAHAYESKRDRKSVV